jgi:maltose/moltooligosaccharide transporter
VGGVGVALVWLYRLDRLMYVLGVGLAAWGALLLINAQPARRGMFATLMRDIDDMPQRMRQLVPVQFFSWLALFAMWLSRPRA